MYFEQNASSDQTVPSDKVWSLFRRSLLNFVGNARERIQQPFGSWTNKTTLYFNHDNFL